MAKRREAVASPRHINTQVLPQTRDRVLKISAALAKKFDVPDFENRIWDAFIPCPEAVNLEDLAAWLRRHASVTMSTEDMEHSLLLLETSGRAGIIAQSLKTKPYKLSVSTYLILDYFIPQIKDVNLDALYSKMYPVPVEQGVGR